MHEVITEGFAGGLLLELCFFFLRLQIWIRALQIKLSLAQLSD